MSTRDTLITLAHIALRDYHDAAAADLILMQLPARREYHERPTSLSDLVFRPEFRDSPPIARDSKISWIKWYRQQYGTTLKEAKDVADRIWIDKGLSAGYC